MKQVTVSQTNSNPAFTGTSYYLRSTALGGKIISEYGPQGQRRTTNVWAGGEVLARQDNADTQTPRLVWQQVNPVTGDGRETDATGRLTAQTHVDSGGVDVGESDPFIDPSVDNQSDIGGGGMSQASIDERVAQLIPGYGGPKCAVDNLLVGCKFALGVGESGAGNINPDSEIADPTTTVSPNLTWVDKWMDCTKEVPRADICQRNEGYFIDDTSGGDILLATQVTEQNADKFSNCLKTAGLDPVEFHHFNEQAANLINQISSLENVSQPLLAITWRYENNFQMNPKPNTNGHPENTDKWDVGPFHINVHWTEAEAKQGGVSFDGLSRTDVYGSTVTGGRDEDQGLRVYGKVSPFNGDPLANGRMAARRLNAFGGSDQHKAMMYAPPDHFEGTGKKKHWVATRTGRGSNYNHYAPALAKFFDCYNQ